MKNKILFILMLTGVMISVKASVTDIKSPNNKLQAKFYLSEEGSLKWKVKYDGKDVILPSELGIAAYQDDLSIKEVLTISKDTIWQPIYGERSRVVDKFVGKTIRLTRKNSRDVLALEIRAYDEGLAFRYFFEEYKDGGAYVSILGENTTFTFPENTLAWHTERAQTPYQLLPLKGWEKESERPLTLQLPNGLYACIAEAQMVNYARTKFALDGKKKNTIRCSQYDIVDEITPFASPWRLVMIADKPGKLLENNDIFLDLNEPCAINETGWIRPGKVFRETTLSTEGGKKAVDFAVKRNLQFIHFDAGWYGNENLEKSDATKVNVDCRRNPKNDLNLKEVINYAKKKNIGVILYVNQEALANQLDEILPLYKDWGVSGIKFGFVQVGSLRWTTWLHDAVRKCAKYQLMVDIHDEYRPTGFSRTYPNLMTQEGIRGNEEMPDATHNTVLPFTRYIAGAADYTICYYRQDFTNVDKHNNYTAPGRIIKTTSAHQLALAAIYYSPLQYLYWYDSPDDSQDEPELAFFDKIPTVWDDTKVLDGNPGNFVTVARKSGNDWFLGGITNNEARNIKIPLFFLDQKSSYNAIIYSDGDKNIKTRTKVKITQKSVNHSQILDFNLKASGGVAIQFIKEK